MSGKQARGGPETWVREARKAMATRWEVVLPGANTGGRLLGVAEEALDTVERLEAQLSMYRYESELSGINAFAAERPVRVEPRLFSLLRRALEISRDTEGAFDLTVGPLLRAWGFAGGRGHRPAPETLEAARAITGSHLVHLDEDDFTIQFLAPGVSLDLGAIGKGYAIDRVREVLEDSGVTCGLVHGGTSTVYGLSTPPGESGWKVALRDPRREEGTTIGAVLLRDRALSVSAPHNKAFREGEQLFGHVLDPRDGEPTQAAVLAAVAHDSATVTDALSTALLVLGREGLPRLAERYPDADFLVMEPEGAHVRITTAGPDFWKLEFTPELLATAIPEFENDGPAATSDA